MVLVVKKGSKMSEESKKKISDRMKEVRKEIPNPMSGKTGELHHNFGKHWDEETRKKMSDAKKGKPSTFKGKRHTEESKQKNSDAHKGKIAWNKGLKTGPESEEHKLKISESIQEWWENLPEDVKIERNNKISESKKNLPPKMGNGGGFYITKDGNSIWLRSSYELRIAKKLDEFNISWEYESRSFDVEGRYYHPDFYLKDYNIWWEVKGYLNEKDRTKINKFCNIYKEECLKLVFLEDIKIFESHNNLSEFEISSIGKELYEIIS